MVENTAVLPAVTQRFRSLARYLLFWVWLTSALGTYTGTAVVLFCCREVANIVVCLPLGGARKGD